MVTFLPDKIRVDAEDGEALLQVSARAGLTINSNCGGTGRCGKCKVQIIGGLVRKADTVELATLTPDELAHHYRLACRIAVKGDMTIRVPHSGIATERKTQLNGHPVFISMQSHVTKKTFTLDPDSCNHATSDIHRVLEALGYEAVSIDSRLIASVPALIKSNNLLTGTIRSGELIDLEEGDTTDQCYGVAFDIGTTTVVGMLWNLMTGKSAGIEALTNSQSHFGADVISRIDYASQGGAHLKELQSRIIGCMKSIIEKLLTGSQIEYRHLYEMTVVGNTTMSHLFLGVNPEQLAKSPYKPVFCHAQNFMAGELGFNSNPHAMIHLMPNIAGHVGSDITAGILATGINDKAGLHLFIDIGTNGEIVLSKDGRLSACSTAAGPAFEGAAIHHGTRAVPGAIEAVALTDETVIIKTIHDKAPCGICGSGLIDVVAEMIRTGIIDKSGKLLNQEEALRTGVPPKLAARLQKMEQGKVFVVAERKGTGSIVITQKDLREVQLAKAAIRSGIMLILSESGAALDDLMSITVAGAFGNYINKESAITIGLLPAVSVDLIINAGNSAGIGASIALLSKESRDAAGKIASEVHHMELASVPSFQEVYIKAMRFGQ